MEVKLLRLLIPPTEPLHCWMTINPFSGKTPWLVSHPPKQKLGAKMFDSYFLYMFINGWINPLSCWILGCAHPKNNLWPMTSFYPRLFKSQDSLVTACMSLGQEFRSLPMRRLFQLLFSAENQSTHNVKPTRKTTVSLDYVKRKCRGPTSCFVTWGLFVVLADQGTRYLYETNFL